MDCFYAAVEMRDHPQYRDIPLAVGGEGKRSVLSTCNYLARQYGVRSAMPALKAKQLCPDLKIVNGRMDVYKSVSQHIREIFLRYTDVIEPLSLDEAFLDVTHCQQFSGSATLIAQDIRRAIFEELQLTASAGVAPNKFLAKIASDENKPNGQFVITPDTVSEFVEDLALRKIPGIGPKTAEKLALHGMTSCQHIRDTTIAHLTHLVGSFAERLYHYSYGRDNREVKVNRIRKSVGVERTFADDLHSAKQCIDQLTMLLPKLEQRLSNYQKRGIHKVGVKLKFADFTQTTIEQQANSIELSVLTHLIEQAFERGNNKSVRLVGLFTGLQPEQSESNEKSQQQLTLAL